VPPVASYFSETEYQAQIQRHYRRNFTVNMLDFACYSWGMSFASMVTILPLYLSHLTASHIGWFFPVFALYGCSSSGFMLAGMSIILEFPRPEDRPIYIGLANSCVAPFGALAPLAGGWIVSTLGYRALFWVAPGSSLIGWLLLHRLVREPRRSKLPTEVAYACT